MGIFKKRGIIKALKGIFVDSKGNNYNTLAGILTKEASCGHGVDYCHKVFRFEDKATGIHYVEYVENGSKVLETLEDYLANQ